MYYVFCEIPTKLNTLKEVLGQGNIEKLPNGNPIYVWEQNGFYAWLDGEEVTGIRININIKEFKLCNKNFEGKILINNQDIETLKWKIDEYNIGKEYKIGKFNLFLEKNSEFLTIEVEGENTLEKNDKYELNHLEEPILKFKTHEKNHAFILYITICKEKLLYYSYNDYSFLFLKLSHIVASFFGSSLQLHTLISSNLHNSCLQLQNEQSYTLHFIFFITSPYILFSIIMKISFLKLTKFKKIYIINQE